MSLRKDPKTGVYTGDFRSRTMKRLHVSLRTKRKAEAMTRHEAVGKLVREGHADLVDLLRRRKFTVEQVEACAREGRSFETLREKRAWPTVAAAAKEYVAWLEANENKSRKTLSAARSQLPKFVEFAHDGERVGDMRVDMVPTAAVDAYTIWLRERFAKNTVTDHVMRVSALYTWLQRQETREARTAGRVARLIHSPVDPETRPKEKPTRDRFLDAGEIERLLAATPDAYRFPVLAALAGGLRDGEVEHLRRDKDVDLVRGMIRVQERDGWKPKCGKERAVPMCDALLAAAKDHRARYAGRLYMLVSQRGGKTVSSSRWGWFDRIVTDAGLHEGVDMENRRNDPNRVTFHTLRHTFASHLVMKGVDLYTVAQLLGDTLRTVEKTYVHLIPDHKREAVQRLGSLLGPAQPPEAGSAGDGAGEVTGSDTGPDENEGFPHV